MEKELRFAIREGGRTVGCFGVVTEMHSHIPVMKTKPN
jgi:translation elongation factor EF-Tu-like GTPase